MIKCKIKLESSKLIVLVGFILKYLSVFALVIYCFHILFGGISLSLSSTTSTVLKTGLNDGVGNNRIGFIPFQISIICTLLFAIRLFHFFSRGEIFTERTVYANMVFSIAIFMSVAIFWLEGLWIGTADLLFGHGDFNVIINLTEIHFVSLGFALLLIIFAMIQVSAKSLIDDVRLIF